MTSINISCVQHSPRLTYVLQWLGEVLGVSFIESKNGKCPISYSNITGIIYIPDAGLLWQTGVAEQQIATGNWQGAPTLFAVHDGYTIPFDIFSAIFYLLSRYEEYLPYTPDKHGRYPHTASLLHSNGWMQRPLVDEWLMLFADLLRRKLGIEIADPSFKFKPTYDIDIAWAYKNKGLLRQGGALLKDAVTGNLSAIHDRLAVWQGKKKDPYDSFDWLKALHEKHRLSAQFFILSALHTSDFDKNISPANSQMQRLIRSLMEYGDIGLHPSYHSDNTPVFTEERDAMESVTQTRITESRQHYIRLRLPHTYRQLIKRGITDDYSMGWTDTAGFRAGTGRTFLWYDLEREEETSLMIHPFCFMDTAARFGCGWSTPQAFAELNKIFSVLKKTGSVLTTVFHNFSLGTDEGWSGWQAEYERLFIDIDAGANTHK